MPLFTPIQDFLAETIPLRPIIGDGILDEEGIMLLQAGTEMGKSYLALQTAFDLASGKPWLGRWTVERACRVGLVQAEIGKARFQRRVRQIAANNSVQQMVVLASRYDLKLDKKEAMIELHQAVSDAKVEVLILDPLRPFLEGDENDSGAIEKFWANIKKMQEATGVALILPHHERKPGPDKSAGKFEARGSGVLTDRPDTIIRLVKTKRPGERLLTFEKVRNGGSDEKPEPVTLLFDRGTGLSTIISGDAETAKLRASVVMGVLAQSVVGWELAELVEQVAQETGFQAKTVERKINAMENEGQIKVERDPSDKRRKIIRSVIQ